VDLELDFEKRYRLVREVIETIVLTVLMFLVIRLAVQNFNIDGHSMEPSLHDTELILVDKWSYHFHTPARGDVIVFVAPPNPSQDYIKRIIGLPGDVITIQDTRVIVNGKPLKEFYVKPENQGNPYASFANRVVPPDSYFVLGDNRDGSSDSRDWGCLPRQNIIGRAALVYWPFGQDNDGLLPDVTSAYTDVPTSSQAGTVLNTNMCHIITNPSQPGLGSSSNDDNLNMAMLLIMPGLFVVCPRRRKIPA
jgi:signal peptidase I